MFTETRSIAVTGYTRHTPSFSSLVSLLSDHFGNFEKGEPFVPPRAFHTAYTASTHVDSCLVREA